MPDRTIETQCCVAGGGPAGILFAYLLARRGVHVTVLEKHRDFFRDFRGDTVHPSTLEVLWELGLLERFLELPHQKVSSVGARIGDYAFRVADVSRVPAHCRFIALMPQWDFLNFLTEQARQFPTFDLQMEHEVTGIRWAGDRVAGVVARAHGQETVDVAAGLVVACDGRHSVTRQAARLPVREYGVPIDVLWFRLSRREGDPKEVLGNVNYGKALVLIDRADYFQAGLIIRKGSFERLQQLGLESFRASIAQMVPELADRVDEIRDWDQVKLLTVKINRLPRWHRPGLLCIGDAAHAMSPAGGVGINLAVQDAVAAANLLGGWFAAGSPPDEALAQVQRRRELPTRVTQRVQLMAHQGFARVFDHPGPIQAPWQLKAITHIPGIQHAAGYAVGIGVRPEHVDSSSGTRLSRGRLAGFAVAVGVALATAVRWRRNAARRWYRRELQRV